MKEKRINASDLLFYIGMIILLLFKFGSAISVLESTILGNYYIYFIGIIFIVASKVISKFSFVEMLLILYGLFSFFVARDTTFLSFITIILAVRNRNIDDVIKFYFTFQIAILSVCIILYPILLIIGSSYARVGVIAGRFRYFFFFEHPNNFSIQCVFTVLAYLYIKRESITFIKSSLIVLMTAIFLYLFPNTQSAVLVLLVYFLFQFIARYAKIMWKPLIRVIFPLITITVVSVIYLYYTGQDSVVSNYITGTFASRFLSASNAFNLYHVNLFGNPMLDVGNLVKLNDQWGTFWFDLAYARMLLAFGIVGAGLFYYLLFKSIKIYIKERNYPILSLMVVVMAYALAEWTAFSITTVFPLLFVSTAFSSQKQILKHKKMKVTFGSK